ncbi:Thiopurine S-methyltransferase (TPMT) [Musa troglodytarum]|uniref:Thiopurine S-methyltransferase (TPMT) n=1 Tax=Musa troglodytarum TaxID=320322 RepID=A0A9E7I517_9LILI|nr:Thiopurine S-methyltransferase (TPMT) [Musa troglodytarum]
MLHFLRVGICQRARHPPRAPGARWIQRPRLPRLPTAINRLRVPAPDMVARMATDGGVEDPARDPASNPKVVMIRGLGYDVVAIAGPERYVVGLDISTSAVEKAKELSSSLPNANQFTFVAADFFAWQPTEKFDLIFDYTFFCAIDPCLRPAWAQKIQEILKPDGELITLIYLISGQEGGPPYNTTVADYEQVLNPVGFKALSIEDNELAVKPRKGNEKIGRWKRLSNKSLL